MTNNTLLIVGNISIDTINIGNQRAEHVGGAALIAAVSAALTGCKVILAGVIGSDFDISVLQGIPNLSTSLVKRVEGKSTRFELLYDQPDKIEGITSKFISYEPTPDKLFDASPHCDHAHISGKAPFKFYEFVPAVEASSFSTDLSFTSLESQLNFISPVLDSLQYIFMNAGELESLRQKNDILANYSGLLVVTKGSEGVSILQNMEELISLPAYATRVVDSTGAGDTFAGAFLGLRVQGHSLEESLIRAISFASLSLEDWGTLHMLEKTNQEIERRIERVRKKRRG